MWTETQIPRKRKANFFKKYSNEKHIYINSYNTTVIIFNYTQTLSRKGVKNYMGS